MNKKLFALGLVAIMFATIFVGCKKGENDPGLSLLSRKARLVGEWQLTAGTWVDNNHNYSFDGTNLTDNHGNDPEIYPYSEKLSIVKDGTFKYTITWTLNSVIETRIYEGYWYFVDGVKDIEVKDEERVEFLLTKYSWSYETGFGTVSDYEVYSGESNTENMLFLLDRLASKEIVVLFDEISDGDIKSGTKTYSIVK